MYLIQRTTKTNTETKHSITAFRSPQNKPALKIKVTNIIRSKNYLSLQLIQVSSSCVHELSVEGWVRGTWVSRNPIKFHQPLTLPKPPLPVLPPLSFNLLTLQAAVGNQESIGVWWGKNQRHASDPSTTPSTLYFPKLKLVLYNGSSLLIM